MARATEGTLANLHEAIALGLLQRLKDEKATASDYSNAIKFVKDNNITCTPGASSALDALAEQLANGGKPSVPDVDEDDLEAAMDRLNNGG